MPLRNTKVWIFGFMTLLAGVLFIGFLELILQTVGFGKNYDFIIEGIGKDKSGKKSLNSQYIALHYFHHLPIKIHALFQDNPWFADTEFSQQKPANTYRIFLVGASTTRGFPYSHRETSYSGFVDKILHDLHPTRKIEVINAGYDALSSFGVLDVVRQVIDESPDLIIVYSGHNEFIGHFGVNSSVNVGHNRPLIRLILRLHASRLYLLNELMVLKLQSISKPLPSQNSGINLFKLMLNKDRVHWDDELHAVAENNYVMNLQEIADLGKRKGVSLLFSTLVSNLKDFSPLQSEFSPSTSNKNREVIFSRLQFAQEAIEHKNFKKAIEFLSASRNLDPHYAQTHFVLAQAYEAASEFAQAREEYQLAREYDKIHLRSCLKLNRTIRRLGRANQIPVIEMEKAFEKSSANGLIGNDLFLEHVHPNINGHLVMADAIVRAMAANNLIASRESWDWKRFRQAQDYVRDSRFDRKEMVQARTTAGLLLLDFPFFKCKEGNALLKSVYRIDQGKKKYNDCLDNYNELHSVAMANNLN